MLFYSDYIIYEDSLRKTWISLSGNDLTFFFFEWEKDLEMHDVCVDAERSLNQ